MVRLNKLKPTTEQIAQMSIMMGNLMTQFQQGMVRMKGNNKGKIQLSNTAIHINHEEM